jgi:hypothetical protein
MKSNHIFNSYAIFFLVIIGIAACSTNKSNENIPVKVVEPQMANFVFQVDYPYPTSDKPQSKLWFTDNCWWAILPSTSGPSLWQRTEEGWKEHKEINFNLQEVPGRVDVWADNDTVTAVGVGTDFLVVFRLVKSMYNSKAQWNTQRLSILYPPEKKDVIETATIARDNVGRWWVAANSGENVCVWTAQETGENWEGPFILAESVGKDDICTIAVIPGGVAVMWSDQLEDAVKMRMHENGQPPEDWEQTIIIEAGNNTADDHLNTALSSDGSLWLTTKNSLDLIDEPQFVLRVRSLMGIWKNYPYYNLDSVLHPSRPIIITVENNNSLILSGHTIYNRSNPYLGVIEFGKIDTTKKSILSEVTTVITPDTIDWEGNNRINDVTGPKQPFPNNAPWIVLASDREGRVYEADLALFFNPK